MAKNEEILRACRRGIKNLDNQAIDAGYKYEGSEPPASAARRATLRTIIDALDCRRGSYNQSQALRKLRGY